MAKSLSGSGGLLSAKKSVFIAFSAYVPLEAFEVLFLLLLVLSGVHMLGSCFLAISNGDTGYFSFF